MCYLFVVYGLPTTRFALSMDLDPLNVGKLIERSSNTCIHLCLCVHSHNCLEEQCRVQAPDGIKRRDAVKIGARGPDDI